MNQIISILVENNAGALNKITGLFARRAFNIESLSVGVTEDKSVSRITMIVDSGNNAAEQVEKQLNKLKEKAEYERQKTEEQKLNTDKSVAAAEMSSYPKLANSIRKNKYILLYPIYDVTAPLKKDLPKITLTIASAVLYKPEN